jgi:hypothetical protein
VHDGPALFREGIRDVLQAIVAAKSIRFLLAVPVVVCEFHADAGEYDAATTLCRKAIERLAGMTRNQRRRAFATAHAPLLHLARAGAPAVERVA